MPHIILCDDLLYTNFVACTKFKDVILDYHQDLGVRWIGNINEF
jgi:hypothetical protein